MLGPHFYYDVIRLARKGWPTLLRVVYLGVLLLSLAVMYRLGSGTVRPAAIAAAARSYALTIIVLQDLLVLVLLPVYVASAIVEEKENQTLEALSITHLTDRELVLGKLGARLLHLGMIVLSSYPLLAFLHLWGNVELPMLLYHAVSTLLLLVTFGSVCIFVSTQSASVFQALSRSYPALLGGGLVMLLVTFGLPWVTGAIIALLTRNWVAWYAPSLLVLVVVHALTTLAALSLAVGAMDRVRRDERRQPRKLTGAFALADRAPPPPPRGRRRRRRSEASRIHPLALPIPDAALFWKECLKDGSSWSLRFRWFPIALALVLAPALVYRLAWMNAGEPFLRQTNFFPLSFTYTTYFIAMGAYLLVVLFQTTMSVAGEREHDTLVFLLLIPDERRRILFAKWIGPLWRNWPILAIALLGPLLGLACGLYPVTTALALLLLPVPLALMLSGVALLLSVLCRRVLFANFGLIGFIAALVLVHVAGARYLGPLLSYYVALAFDVSANTFVQTDYGPVRLLALYEQSAFLAVAALCLTIAFWRFGVRDYGAR